MPKKTELIEPIPATMEEVVRAIFANHTKTLTSQTPQYTPDLTISRLEYTIFMLRTMIGRSCNFL